MIKSAYILAKNESKNIVRSVKALIDAGLQVSVLDSGSVDTTRDLAMQHGAEVVNYHYINHLLAYNQLTSSASANEAILILDADMIVSTKLIDEIYQILFTQAMRPDVVLTPISMYWEGQPLHYSSLCPPKPIAFRGGKSYFEPIGHGERLREGVHQQTTHSQLIHDDQKELGQVLQTQARYSRELLKRSLLGSLNLRDRIRVHSPLFVFITPIYSYVIKRGFLDGRVGLIYAMDRLIAEAIAFRTAISPTIQADLQRDMLEQTYHLNNTSAPTSKLT